MSKYKPYVFRLNGVIRDFVKDLNIELEKKELYNYDYSEWHLDNKPDANCYEITLKNLFWKNLKPFDDSWYQVNYFFNQCIPIYIASDRGDIEKDMEWLDAWKIQYDKVIPLHIDFESTIKKLNPELIVDDDPIRVRYLNTIGYNAVLRRAWYNRDHRNDIPSIGSLLEIKDK